MKKEILEAVNQAREFFKINGFPGNFFTLLEKENYIDKFNLILFKEDIGDLSGFIGYGEHDITIICVNYSRSIGHQNFTLAHEIGHWFLHKGKSFSDDSSSIGSSEEVREKEANEFAKELLYPEQEFLKDYTIANENKLFLKAKRKELAIYINELCHKYTISFEVVLRRMLYKYKLGAKYKCIDKEIREALGGNISEAFDKDFYIPNDQVEWYQQLRKPYDELEKRLTVLLEKGEIGEATADSIRYRNGLER